MPRFSLFCLILWLPLVAGCEGCRNADDAGADDQDKQIPLQDFSDDIPSVFPGDLNSITSGIKPGHWLTASQPLKSNKTDIRGELLSTVSVSADNNQSGTTQMANSRLATRRPAVLPKGQLRRFDFRLLAPVPPALINKKSYLNSRLFSSGGVQLHNTGRQPFNVLAGQEFFFVILTSRPERFAKFQVAYWVEPPRDKYRFQDQATNYQIVIPPVDDLLPLSETMLDWTATSVLFWDDLSPDALTPAQQTAIADWVRFGGQLIVNGADASDAIANTTLANLLPLKPTGNIELDPAAATELLQRHAVASDTSTEKQISLVKDQSARLAVDGNATDDAISVPNSGNLILERSVGRGRVVQARFDLTSDWLSNWLSYDSFVNSVLLRRPRRKYVNETDLILLQTYPGQPTNQSNPTFNSRFRIAARDAILPPPRKPILAGTESTTRQQEADASAEADQAAKPDTRLALARKSDFLTRINSATGISGWNDTSDAVAICRQVLSDESGIEIPDSSLVIRSLGYYLLILVPVNYLIFRLLGRLEYAWLAVPLIAIGGAVWVARAARLDIGFARSQTQLAMVELQPDYARAHLSRIVAIYNSLSSSYDLEFDSIDGVAAPVAGATEIGDETLFKTGYGEGSVLSELAVGSNQVRLVHAEQIIDMGGSVQLVDDDKLINQTSYDLLDAYVIEKSETGDVQISALGQCNSGSAVKLRRRPAGEVSIVNGLPMQANRLISRLASPSAMYPGTTRLVARIDGPLPGMTITPAANQTMSQTVVLAHLKHQAIPPVEVDDNLVNDFIDVLTDDSVDTGDEQIE